MHQSLRQHINTTLLTHTLQTTYITLRFLIGLDFLIITLCLYFFLSWMSSLSISSSAISACTCSNHVLLGLPTGLLHSTLNSIHFFTQSSSFSLSHVHISLPTTSNDSCNRLNSNQLSQFLISLSVFHGNATHPSNNLHI